MHFDCKNDKTFVTFLCPGCGSTYSFKLGCHSRICPTCNKDKSIRLIKKYSKIDTVLKNPYFVTLTTKNVSPDKLKEGKTKLKNSFKKLCNRAPYRRWFTGGLYAIEFTVNRVRDDFNLHMHLCIDSCIDLKRANYIGFASDNPSKVKRGIKQDWYEITGDSYIVDWQKTRHPKKAVSYCLKYLAKNVDYYLYDGLVQSVLYKSRMISMFGSCYNCPITAKLPFVCECGYSDGLEFFCVGSYSRGGYWYNGSYHLNPKFTLDDFS
jgi:Replication protein.